MWPICTSTRSVFAVRSGLSRLAPRRTRTGRQVTKSLWARVTSALQPPAVFRAAVGHQMRRTKAGAIDLVSKVAVFS
jgi:hypothetical protein